MREVLFDAEDGITVRITSNISFDKSQKGCMVRIERGAGERQIVLGTYPGDKLDVIIEALKTAKARIESSVSGG